MSPRQLSAHPEGSRSRADRPRVIDSDHEEEYVARIVRRLGLLPRAAGGRPAGGVGWRWQARRRASVDSGQLAVALAAVPAFVLVWAGVEKLRHPFPASLAIVRFGLAKRVRPVVGRVAGATEVAAGALLLARPQSPWAYVPAA